MNILLGLAVVVHGLIHLLYAGQSARRFELRPGMAWPDGSWALSGLFGNEAVRSLAAVACVLAAAGFLAGGVVLFASQAWWRPVVIGSAAFSTLALLLLWDGKLQALADKGLIAVIINLAILVALLFFSWPRLDF